MKDPKQIGNKSQIDLSNVANLTPTQLAELAGNIAETNIRNGVVYELTSLQNSSILQNESGFIYPYFGWMTTKYRGNFELAFSMRVEYEINNNTNRIETIVGYIKCYKEDTGLGNSGQEDFNIEVTKNQSRNIDLRIIRATDNSANRHYFGIMPSLTDDNNGDTYDSITDIQRVEIKLFDIKSQNFMYNGLTSRSSITLDYIVPAKWDQWTHNWTDADHQALQDNIDQVATDLTDLDNSTSISLGAIQSQLNDLEDDWVKAPWTKRSMDGQYNCIQFYNGTTSVNSSVSYSEANSWVKYRKVSTLVDGSNTRNVWEVVFEISGIMFPTDGTYVDTVRINYVLLFLGSNIPNLNFTIQSIVQGSSTSERYPCQYLSGARGVVSGYGVDQSRLNAYTIIDDGFSYARTLITPYGTGSLGFGYTNYINRDDQSVGQVPAFYSSALLGKFYVATENVSINNLSGE